MEEILLFIKRFESAKELFLSGCCYWFADILYERFYYDYGIVEIYYNPVDNHFATMIDNILYDVTGSINDNGFICWNDYKIEEPFGARRIEEYCIKLKDADKDG